MVLMVLKLTCVSWGLVKSVPNSVLGDLWFFPGSENGGRTGGKEESRGGDKVRSI